MSTHDRITVPEKFTPHRFADIEAPRDSLQTQFDFPAQMEGIEPIDFPSGPFGKPTTFEGLASPMKFPTPHRLGEFISPAKPKQTFPNLDVYLESVKKGTEKIFEEEPEAEEEEEEEEEKGRRRGAARRRTRAAVPAAIEARWDYDEKPMLERYCYECRVIF